MLPTSWQKEFLFSYDTNEYPFVELVQQMLETTDCLEHTHLLDKDSTKEGYIVFGNDQGTPLHKKFYQSYLFENFKALYKKWMEEVIGNSLIVYF